MSKELEEFEDEEIIRSVMSENKVILLNPEEKFKANPKSRKYAINAKCCDYVGGANTEGYRREIKLCPIKTCSLYEFRPYQG